MSLVALARCCPTWADFRPVHAFEAQVDVVATRSSGAFTRVFELRVVQVADQIAVFERPVGGTLPACCPERHINPDGVNRPVNLTPHRRPILTPSCAAV
ncbi:E2 domain-containing protein [Bradyrhizobium diazoefficiens]